MIITIYILMILGLLSCYNEEFEMIGRAESLIYGSLPLVKDVAWSSPMVGIGWTRRL